MRELVVEAAVVGLVEEVLLELVEDDERGRIHRRDDVLDRVFERVASELELRIVVQQRPRGGLERGDQVGLRIALPRAEDHRNVARRAALRDAARRELP